MEWAPWVACGRRQLQATLQRLESEPAKAEAEGAARGDAEGGETRPGGEGEELKEADPNLTKAEVAV